MRAVKSVLTTAGKINDYVLTTCPKVTDGIHICICICAVSIYFFICQIVKPLIKKYNRFNWAKLHGLFIEEDSIDNSNELDVKYRALAKLFYSSNV